MFFHVSRADGESSQFFFAAYSEEGNMADDWHVLDRHGDEVVGAEPDEQHTVTVTVPALDCGDPFLHFGRMLLLLHASHFAPPVSVVDLARICVQADRCERAHALAVEDPRQTPMLRERVLRDAFATVAARRGQVPCFKPAQFEDLRQEAARLFPPEPPPPPTLLQRFCESLATVCRAVERAVRRTCRSAAAHAR
jgi:hypothetical protein